MRRRWKKTMGTSKIRLVAVDMDGTLLNRERKITQYTQNVKIGRASCRERV